MNAFARTLFASAVLVSPLCIADTFAQTASTQTSEAQTSLAQVATAQDGTPVVDPAPTAPAANDATNTNTNTEAAAQPQSARTCLTLTGSRVTAQRNLRAAREGRSERECANSNGRVYSEQDIERTGQRSVADALRSLDTGVR